MRVARIVYFAAWWLAIWYALMSVTRAFLPRPFSGITATIGSLRLPVDRIGPVLWPYGSWAVTTLWRSSTEPPVIQGALFGFLPWFLMPLSMLLLDETFSAASVRRVHILRGLAYSAPGAMLAVHAMIGLLLAGSTAFLARGIAAPPYVAIAVLYPAWLTAWWWLFIKRYLRLPHAPWIALVMMVASLLATASVLLWSSIPRI